jgi:ppGpp synthetase/RelA/SpoT-type nucleotidyltranferase
MDKSNINKFIRQYKQKKDIYENFSVAVTNILKTILDSIGFKYQHIPSRVKEVYSLEEKLKTNRDLQKIKNVSEVQDLAGCRIIFYLDSDIKKFANYIYKEFEVIKKDLKYSDDDYNADHFVVKLKKDRLKLPEYYMYKDLLCEIQLTTILFHSWAEMAHDVLYKDKEELSKFDIESYKAIQKIFSDVMKKYIKEANRSFEFAYWLVEKLRKGKKVFSIEFFSEITDLTSLNEIHQNLSLLYQFTQQYGDKTPKGFNIINIIKIVLVKSKTLQQKPIKNSIMDISGYSYEDNAKISMDILGYLRYLYIEEVLEITMDLSLDKNQEIRKKALEVIKTIAEYNLNVLNKINYGAQIFVLKKIESLNSSLLTKYFEAICELLKAILDPEFEGSSMDSYKTFTIKFGPMPVTDQLKKIRKRAINTLKKLYRIQNNLVRKITIIKILDNASQLPTRGEVNEDMKKMVIDNTNYVLAFYLSIISSADNEILRIIEEQLYWFKHRLKEEELTNLQKVKEIICSNKEYEIYRVFVGFTRGISSDYKNEVEFRNRKIEEYIGNISSDNFKIWKSRIFSIAKKYNIVGAGELQFFNKFLNFLSKQKSNLGIKLIKEKDLEPFLIHIISGIWQSKLKSKARKIIEQWIKNEEKLDICVDLFSYVSEIDLKILEKIFITAKKKKATEVLNKIIIATIISKNKKIKKIFLNTMIELTNNNSSEWSRSYLGDPEFILDTLTIDEYEIILENLLLAKNISHYEEVVLYPIAKKSPEKVINLFHKRLSCSKGKRYSDRYKAVPYSLGDLSKILRDKKDIVIDSLLKWFKEKDRIHHFEAAHLLNIIFPQFDDTLEKICIKFIKSSDERAIETVFGILGAYEGEKFLLKTCKAIIKKYPKNTGFKKELFRVLSKTGTVSGEYGFVEAYKKKKELIKEWYKDKSKDVKQFYKEYIKFLDKMILYEKKEADEEIDFMKREYGIIDDGSKE